MNLEEELRKFEDNIKSHHKQNKDNLIYLRLSRLDNDIKDLDKRIIDALKKLKADFKSLLVKYPKLKDEGFLLFVEVKSAYKNSTREVFIDLYLYLRIICWF